MSRLTRTIAAIGALLVILTLPLVPAHFIFYSSLGTSPSGVGLNFGDLVQRSAPGLLTLVILLAFSLLALYSLVVLINLMFVPFNTRKTKLFAWGWLFTLLMLSILLPKVWPRMAEWLLLGWLVLGLVLGVFALFPGAWRSLMSGVLTGAPLYALVAVGLVLFGPYLRRLPEGVITGQPPSSPSEALLGLLVALVGLPLFLILCVVLFLPLLFVMSEDPSRSGWRWSILRRATAYLSLRRALTVFGVVVVVATYIVILVISSWNAAMIKKGLDPGIFGVPALDQVVENTYGLSVTCVLISPIKPYPSYLPPKALLLGSRDASGYILVWDDKGAREVPREVIELARLNDAACVKRG